MPPSVLTPDDAALCDRLARYWSYRYNYGSVLLDGEELRQIACIGAWEGLCCYPQGSPIMREAWASQYARKAIRAAIQKHRLLSIQKHEVPLRAPFAGEEDEEGDESKNSGLAIWDPENIWLSIPFRPDDLWAAMRRLVPLERHVIVAHYWREQSYGAMASHLGLYPSQVESAHGDALAHLRVLLGVAPAPAPMDDPIERWHAIRAMIALGMTHRAIGDTLGLKPRCVGLIARRPQPRGAVTHCPQGHPYDEANTKVRPDGRRRCKACSREEARRRRATQKRTSPQKGYASRPPTKVP